MNAVLPVVYVSQDIDNISEKRLNSVLQPLGVEISFRQPETEYFLQFVDNKIVLRHSFHKEKVFADFVGGALSHRTHFQGKELIAKA
ncbi:MAG: hypothetical protein J5680_02435, partial [Neisseriaceae bacterium]|nr:hypothetical protein [Neisseriaceae bacterium]